MWRSPDERPLLTSRAVAVEALASTETRPQRREPKALLVLLGAVVLVGAVVGALRTDRPPSSDVAVAVPRVDPAMLEALVERSPPLGASLASPPPSAAAAAEAEAKEEVRITVYTIGDSSTVSFPTIFLESFVAPTLDARASFHFYPGTLSVRSAPALLERRPSRAFDGYARQYGSWFQSKPTPS